ncbi:MAG: molybdopterin molybdotransferase MoeA [Hyphomicrobiales bacterium]|nr:molybdopterin molybdotransferase MoeA [Hyphomicrobiales bacterium]
MSLIPVAEALSRILVDVVPLQAEEVPLAAAYGRRLAGDIEALRTQPPFSNSAMDGYAVCAEDVATVPATLTVIGESAAGRRYSGDIGPGEAVRIFTGAPMPGGADTIVIQEDTERDGDRVTVKQVSKPGRFVRPEGLDFKTGEALLKAGQRLSAKDVALAASMNHATLAVHRRPRVAVLANGDELVLPGEALGPDQIVASNSFGVAALAEAAGGTALDLGIAPDQPAAIEAAIARAIDEKADILVTLGGASVGDHDLIQDALVKAGMTLDFWRIAMRPGKPLMFGRLGEMRVIGLPGNPVSAMVCGLLFLRPLIAALCGDPAPSEDSEEAILGTDLAANDQRQDYLRAELRRDDAGRLVATPFMMQDSSMLALLARSDCLVVRPPHAPPAKAGETCRILRLTD